MSRTLTTALALLVLPLILCCGSPRSNEVAIQKPSSTPASQTQTELSDESLMTFVNSFASENQTEQPRAWQELARYPRAELIAHLRKLQETRNAEREQVAIAFLFCNLDYEVTNNKRIIVNAFQKEPHNQNNDADWQADLVWRLLQKGHKDLLPVLFKASEWSDGALSEALADYFTDLRKAHPKDFAAQLSGESKATQQAVYRLLRYPSGQ